MKKKYFTLFNVYIRIRNIDSVIRERGDGVVVYWIIIMEHEEEFNLDDMREMGGEAFTGPMDPIKFTIIPTTTNTTTSTTATNTSTSSTSTSIKRAKKDKGSSTPKKRRKTICNDNNPLPPPPPPPPEILKDQCNNDINNKKNDDIKLKRHHSSSSIVGGDSSSSSSTTSNGEEKENLSKKRKVKLDKQLFGKIYRNINKSQNLKTARSSDKEQSDYNFGDWDTLSKYLISNVIHYNNDSLICGKKPPPLKSKYLSEIFNDTLTYFLKMDEKDDPDFSKSIVKLKSAFIDTESMYQLLVLYYYANAYCEYFNETESSPLDISDDSEMETNWNKMFKICDISLIKRLKSKKTKKIERREKKINLYKLVQYQIRKRFEICENLDHPIITAIIEAEINNNINIGDEAFKKYIPIVGFVNLLSFIYDILIFGQSKLVIKRENIEFKCT